MAQPLVVEIGTFVGIGLGTGLLLYLLLFPIIKRYAKESQAVFLRNLVNGIGSFVIIWTILGSISLFLTYNANNQTVKDSIGIYIPDIQLTIQILFIITILIVFARAISLFLNYHMRKGNLPQTTIFHNLMRFLIFVYAVILILQAFRVDVGPLLATLGVGALAVALALQDTLSNLFAGIYIILVRQISPGDYIQLQSGEAGYVTDINWRNTTIRTMQNNLIIIPNSNMTSTIITNYSLPKKDMSVKIPIGVGYESDLELVERVTIEVTSETLKNMGITLVNPPKVRYNLFGNSSINFNLIVTIKDFEQQFLVQHQLIKDLMARYRIEKINIPFPITTVYLEKD